MRDIAVMNAGFRELCACDGRLRRLSLHLRARVMEAVVRLAAP